jgi:MFS family permease
MTVEAVKPAADHLDLADVERRIKAIFIGSVGNLVEWYDFYAYTAFALYFAPAFFPNSDPVVQQLNAAVLFAATFLMRPLGGWLFGYIADRYGRRLSLTLSVVCMCFGSLIIAVTPTYASIGIAAPAILALARIIEGLSLGGEYGASATYLSEVGLYEIAPDTTARVIINERTGTVVAGENVKISATAIAHGNLVIVLAESPIVSQPQAPFIGNAAGSTVTLPRSQLDVTEQKPRLNVVPQATSVADVARALNSLGVSPRDLISIFQSLKQAGALHAELEIK